MAMRFVLFIVLTVPQFVIGLNILAIISLPMRSHYMAFQQLFRELANRGHQVTVLNNFPDDKPMPNLRFIDLEEYAHNASKNRHPLDYYEHVGSSYVRFMNMYRLRAAGNVRRDCENLFTNPNVKAHYNEGVKYDVIFVEQFRSDCGLAYAATFYEAPIIGITSHVLLPWSYPRLGIPFDAAADPFYFSNSGSNPSLYHKVETTVANFFLNTIAKWCAHRNIYDVFKIYLPDYDLDIENIARERMRMMFVYQHFSLTGARVLGPQVLEIGGVHIGTPKPVPTDIERFLSDAIHGAIYVSFGSNLKANTMSKEKLNEFLTAFKRLPYKVLWKFENASLPVGNENVYTSSWFPQLDILCHPKILAFVSHGGMLSISETAHCAKPILTIPFFGDQFSNSAAVSAVGLGKTLYFNELNADNLEQAIRDLTSQKMQQNAQRVSRQWHDRPQPVMDSAIYWTEYVARHRTAPPSLPSKYNKWFESSLIDVYTVLLLIVMLFCLLSYAIFKLLKLVLVILVGQIVVGKKVKGE